MSNYNIEQYAHTLYEVISDTKDSDYDKVINNLITVLKSNNDLGKYEQIVQKYEEIYYQSKQNPNIEVTTTSNDKSKAIVESLNKIIKNGNFTTKSDDKIIGGVTIKIDDTLIDGSIKTQLDNLHNSLNK